MSLKLISIKSPIQRVLRSTQEECMRSRMTPTTDPPRWYTYETPEGRIQLGQATKPTVVIDPQGSVPAGQDGAGRPVLALLPLDACRRLETLKWQGNLTVVLDVLEAVNAGLTEQLRDSAPAGTD